MSDSVLVGLIGAVALIVSTWLQRRPTKTQREIKDLAQTTVDQTEKVGNGFTKKVKGDLDQLKKSSGALHRRLDQISEVLVNFDGRLVHLEEHDKHEDPPASDVPQGPGRRASDHGSSDRDELQ